VIAFRGIDKNTDRTGLDPGFHQDNKGSDSALLGVWRPRRGMEKSAATKKANPVLLLSGLEAMGEAYTVVSVTAGTIFGDSDFND
jgi:hypothetical protein